MWNPGQGSPIHDHCTWGVIGQYQGEEEESRFRIINNRLERIGLVFERPGDVNHVYPQAVFATAVPRHFNFGNLEQAGGMSMMH